MYLEYFGFHEEPFNITPNSRFLYLSQRHREALAALLFGIQQRKGFIALTGNIGCGKTTICRALLNQLDRENTRVAMILNPQLSDLELLQAINAEFSLPDDLTSKRQLMNALNEFLLEEFRHDRTVVLLIDEAQRLGPEALEQVRLLSNLETETAKLIQIALVGQPELAELLDLPELEQLNQRITVRYHITPLTLDEVSDYIGHRIEVAKPVRPVKFNLRALKRIYEFSAGVPRRVNVVCDRALLITYAQEKYEVSEDVVEKAIQELGGMPRRHRKGGRAAAPSAVQQAMAEDAAPMMPAADGSPRTIPPTPLPLRREPDVAPERAGIGNWAIAVAVLVGFSVIAWGLRGSGSGSPAVAPLPRAGGFDSGDGIVVARQQPPSAADAPQPPVIALAATPSPTATATPVPTAPPPPTPVPPTESPVPTTAEPSPTAEPEPTPAPPTPTVELTPTASATPSPEPSPSPSPEPTPIPALPPTPAPTTASPTAQPEPVASAEPVSIQAAAAATTTTPTVALASPAPTVPPPTPSPESTPVETTLVPTPTQAAGMLGEMLQPPSPSPTQETRLSWQYDADGIVRVQAAEITFPAALLTWLSQTSGQRLSEAELARLRGLSAAEIAALQMTTGRAPLFLREARLPGDLALLGPAQLPAILQLENDATGYGPWTVLLSIDGAQVTLLDPRGGRIAAPMDTVADSLTAVVRPFFDRESITGLRSGDRGDRVSALQRRLSRAGTYRAEPSGIYDPFTTAALQQFCQDRQLKLEDPIGPLLALEIIGATEAAP